MQEAPPIARPDPMYARPVRPTSRSVIAGWPEYVRDAYHAAIIERRMMEFCEHFPLYAAEIGFRRRDPTSTPQ